MSDSEGSSSSSSDSAEEEKEERVDQKQDKKKKDKKAHKKKEKKHKSKDKKKHKKRKRGSDDDSDKDSKKRKKEEKKMVKAAKEYLKKQAEEQVELPPNVPHRMSAEHDYYKYLKEFKVYLKAVKQINFESLDKAGARKNFEEFAKDWNRGRLPDMYYHGLPTDIIAENTKTAHKWGFTKNLTEQEKFTLESTTHRVMSASGMGAGKQQAPGPQRSAPGKATGGGARSKEEEQLLKEERIEAEKAKRKALRDKDKVVMEELAPKATGREAKIENRRAKSDTIHGAARAAEEARDGLALDESITMGGGDEFSTVKKRMQARGERKATDRERLVQEAQEREKATMAKLLADLGLKPGDKVTIAKRTT